MIFKKRPRLLLNATNNLTEMSIDDGQQRLLSSAVSQPVRTPINQSNLLPWIHSPEQVAQLIQTSLTQGLSTETAKSRLKQWGPNTFPIPHHSFFAVFKEEIKEPLIVMLLVVGLLYFIWGQLEEAISVLVVIMICISVEIGTEYKAKNALAKLSASTHQPDVIVIRDGRIRHISAQSVVIGDLMEVSSGEKIVADGRLVTSTWLQIDESALTGETEVVHKSSNEILSDSTALHLRNNMVMAETIVTEGHARFVVTATAVHTITGQIRETINKTRTPKTPLQQAMKKLALRLTVVAAAACALVFATGFMRHLSYENVILMSLSLAFATIPEELPILIKAVLAVGAVQLSKSYVLVKSLKTAESLGGISVILTDKTGTLTYNTLTVRVCTILGSSLQETMQVPTSPLMLSSLSNEAALQPLLSTWLLSSPSLNQELLINRDENRRYKIGGVRDRFDKALVTSCIQSELVDQYMLIPQLEQLIVDSSTTEIKQLLPFDSWRRRSGCVRGIADGNYVLYCRGSTESLLELCTSAQNRDGSRITLDAEVKSEVLSRLQQMTSQGIRVISFASKSAIEPQMLESYARLEGSSNDSTRTGQRESRFSELESNMTFVGMVGFSDPVREGVAIAIQELQNAGIVVKMVTGDHVQTGAAIAKQVGIITNPHQVSQEAIVPFVEEREDGGLASLQDVIIEDNADIRCYCRMTPDDKYNLVLQHQAKGHMVLVTGDGFNDGPALASADVGMAMGAGGTDMARAAAGLVITDDSFPSVVTAIREGRRILDNLRKAIRFYLACKLTLVLLFFISLSAVSYVPMLPLHVILLECFMDLGASTAFTTEAFDNNIMQKLPSQWDRKHFLSGYTFWPTILVSGLCMYGVVGGVFFLASQAVTENNDNVDVNVVQTMTLVTWLISHVLLASSMRTFHRSILFDSIWKLVPGVTNVSGSDSQLTLFSNPLLLVWTITAIGFAILAISIAPLRSLIVLSDLSVKLKYPGSNSLESAYTMPFLLPFLVFLMSELLKFLYSKRHRT